MFKAVQGAIIHANQILNNFLKSETGQNFKGSEVFAVGDYIGGLLMYEAFSKQEHQPVGRNASANSANIPLRLSENDKGENVSSKYGCNYFRETDVYFSVFSHKYEIKYDFVKRPE